MNFIREDFKYKSLSTILLPLIFKVQLLQLLIPCSIATSKNSVEFNPVWNPVKENNGILNQLFQPRSEVPFSLSQLLLLPGIIHQGIKDGKENLDLHLVLNSDSDSDTDLDPVTAAGTSGWKWKLHGEGDNNLEDNKNIQDKPQYISLTVQIPTALIQYEKQLELRSGGKFSLITPLHNYTYQSYANVNLRCVGIQYFMESIFNPLQTCFVLYFITTKHIFPQPLPFHKVNVNVNLNTQTNTKSILNSHLNSILNSETSKGKNKVKSKTHINNKQQQFWSRKSLNPNSADEDLDFPFPQSGNERKAENPNQDPDQNQQQTANGIEKSPNPVSQNQLFAFPNQNLISRFTKPEFQFQPQPAEPLLKEIIVGNTETETTRTGTGMKTTRKSHFKSTALTQEPNGITTDTHRIYRDYRPVALKGLHLVKVLKTNMQPESEAENELLLKLENRDEDENRMKVKALIKNPNRVQKNYYSRNRTGKKFSVIINSKSRVKHYPTSRKYYSVH